MKYIFENLHWREFERLVIYYLKEKIGEGLWSFDGTQDMGRDAAFNGKANEYPSKSHPWSGNWIFQSKHRTTRRKTLEQVEAELVRSLKGELEKTFVKYGFDCDNYIYITSLNVGNTFRDSCAHLFAEFCVKHRLTERRFAVIEYKDLEVFISSQPFIRREFPSLLSFTDLETVFLKKEETKNKGYIKSARVNIPKFVSTAHYAKAASLLLDHPFLMLVGDPKSGKTSIVEALAVTSLEEGRRRPYFIRTTDELFTFISYLPAKQGALFICDDIFGKHELDESKLDDWTNYFRSVMGLIDEHHRFLFTTRKYIYEQFANRSGLREMFPGETDPNRFVIKLRSLSKEEREQILEKHLSFSGLPEKIVESARSLSGTILACKDFSPEVIRSLMSLLKGAKAKKDVYLIVTKHLEHPDQYVYDFFDQITTEKRLLLLSIAVSRSSETHQVEKGFLALLEDCALQPSIIFERFIEELDGSIVNKREYLDSSEIEYYHPSMFDVLVGICGGDRHYRGLLLKHVNAELLWFLTLREAGRGSNKIQILGDEFDGLMAGVNALLNEADLRTAAIVARWATSLSNELAYNLSLRDQIRDLKNLLNERTGTSEFLDSHVSEPIQHWIDFLDRWQLLSRHLSSSYAAGVEAANRDYSRTDYWKLLFLLEASSAGFIESNGDKVVMSSFTKSLAHSVKGLSLGLNMTEGRPKTDEGWLPLFYELDDLIRKLKKSGAGRQIIEHEIVDDWERVKRFSEFARNRHFGMVKSGYWKSTPRIRAQTSLLDWASN